MNNNWIYKRMPDNPLGNERGMILVVALWLLVFLSSLGLAANLVTRVDLDISGNYKNETDAFYLAEAGLQRALGKINTVGYWADDLDNQADAFAGDNTQLIDGIYTVQVFLDDPDTKMMRIVSTGQVDGTTSSSTVEAILTTVEFEVDGYASFSCGYINLSTFGTVILNGPSYSAGTFDIGGRGTYIVNGTAMALGRLKISNEGWVAGDAISNDLVKIIGNGNAEYDDDDPYTPHTDPNNDGFAINPGILMGNAAAGTNFWLVAPGQIFGGDAAGLGSTVPDLCAPDILAKTTYTHEMINDYRSHPDKTYSSPLVLNSGDTALMGGGVILMKSNLRVEDDILYDQDLVIVVEGNFNVKASLVPDPDPAAEDQNPTVAIYVPYRGVARLAGATTTLNGFIQAGAIKGDGTTLTGGIVYVAPETGSSPVNMITINGYVTALDGALQAVNSGSLTVNYEKIENDATLSRYEIGQWHRL